MFERKEPYKEGELNVTPETAEAEAEKANREVATGTDPSLWEDLL